MRHVVTEDGRVLDVVALLQGGGDLRDVGPLLSASHASMRDDFEITVPQVDVAQDRLAAGVGVPDALEVDGDRAAPLGHAVLARVRDVGGGVDHADHPELDDFGDAHVALSSGASGYVRVDWFTPDGLRTWGDGRTFILGTEGYIELRKYVDVTTDNGPGQVLLVDGEGEHRIEATGQVGYPFFGDLILDVLHRTENAMTQEHVFTSVELALTAQDQARVLKEAPGA